MSSCLGFYSIADHSDLRSVEKNSPRRTSLALQDLKFAIVPSLTGLGFTLARIITYLFFRTYTKKSYKEP